MKRVSIEDLVALVLRLGVVCSAMLLAAGLVIIYATQSSPAAASFGNRLLVIGVFALFATPVMRVLMSIISFAAERDWLYVVITAIVFINIMFAVFIVPSLLHI